MRTSEINEIREAIKGFSDAVNKHFQEHPQAEKYETEKGDSIIEKLSAIRPALRSFLEESA